ncbi:MAG: TonB-dependent receptor [Spirosomataceae bacterium]
MKTPFFRLLTVGLVSSTMAWAQQTTPPSTPLDSTHALSEIVVTASRRAESVVKSPISIELMDNRSIQHHTAPSYFDAIENLKGVQLLTSSLGFKVYNTRGFANPTNVRFVQMVEGIDNQAPHIGSPIGSALAPTDLDIDHVEVVPGVASALYGVNALNGLVNLFTKNPFDYQGVSIQQKTGINHLNDANAAAHLYSETALRWAKAWNNRWAIKLNLDYLTGYDWISDNNQDLNPNGNATLSLFGNDNPAYDGINGYGNESSNRRTLTLSGKRVSVARTGYFEKDIADFSIRNLKGDVALHFRPRPNWELIYLYRWGQLDNLYQRTNRFRLNDYWLDQHVLMFKIPSLEIKAYRTSENTGKSYNIRSMAENIDRGYKSDDVWYKDFTTAYNQQIVAGKTLAEALQAARSQADAGRPVPHTAAFESQIEKLSSINNWDIGAALQVKTWLYHLDVQANLSQQLLADLAHRWKFSLMVGADYRRYVVFPDGNYFINPIKPDQNLTYTKQGGVVQLRKQLWQDKLSISASLRADKNEYFPLRWNPQIALLFNPNPAHYFRLSFQNGYRFPSLFEAFSNVNSGGVKRVGGLPVMSSGIFENSYFKTSVDAFQAAITSDVNTKGIPLTQAILQNKALLKKNDYTYIQPEQVKSIEIGYKGVFLQQRLWIDADFYYNQYQNFMAQVEVILPKTTSSNPDTIAVYLNDKTRQDRYRLWTNSTSTVYNYGASWGVRYRFIPSKQYVLSANASFAQLDRKDRNDGLEEAFNTPRWIMNVGIQQLPGQSPWGAGVQLKWQEGFLWQSSLATGYVPAFTSLDAQVSYHFKQPNIQIKLAANNLLNRYYYNFLAGPSVGGLYYLTLTLAP